MLPANLSARCRMGTFFPMGWRQYRYSALSSITDKSAPAMMLLMLRTHPTSRMRFEMLGVLRGVTSQTTARPGCISANVYEGAGDDDEVLYVERWSVREPMLDHIRSAVFARILLAMEMSDSRPEFVCYETGQTWGMELIQDVRRMPS